MRHIREVLRLALLLNLSVRGIARSCRISPSTASDYVQRAKLAELRWPLPPELDEDDALERLLFRDHEPAIKRRPEPDWSRIHEDLRKSRHVTKLLLWQEYREEQPDGLGYSQFCERYTDWSRRLGVVMRQTHRAGEKMFVDFSGDGIPLREGPDGEERVAKLFVAVLGGSSLTYVEPVLHEDLPTWLGCHARAFEFFGGVPEVVVPDNLRAGVTRPDRYDPELNPSYADLARHYGVAVIPARVRKPRDKAKVEQAVLLAERWIIAALRHRSFKSMADLREAIAPLVEKLNTRIMRRLGKSRRDIFESIERSTLRPLPATPFELADWAKATLNLDYHIEYDHHFYSAPYTLTGETVDVRATERVVEVLHGGHRVASHVRSRVAGAKTTLPEHMPRSHRAHAEWTPSKIVAWAATVGPNTSTMVEKIMETRPHPEQGFRSCLGLVRLKDSFPAERIERACIRALRAQTYSRKSVLLILKNQLDSVDLDEEPAPPPMPAHANVRGSTYYE